MNSKLDDVIKTQCSNGNWNYSPYMHGLTNGLILAKAILEEKDPIYLDAPKERLCDKKKEVEK